jgi:hypothetical protein
MDAARLLAKSSAASEKALSWSPKRWTRFSLSISRMYGVVAMAKSMPAKER